MNNPTMPLIRVTTTKLPGSMFVRFETHIMMEPNGPWEVRERPTECHKVQLAGWLAERQRYADELGGIFVVVSK